MPLVASRSNASAKAFGWSSAPSAEVLGGMVLMTPTSIASTGTGNSSSIGANGSVTFSTCVTLSLNGVFTSDYDNYMICIRESGASIDGIVGRYRVSGSDATGTNYVQQYILANDTTISAVRTSAATYIALGNIESGYDGLTCYVYGPNLAQPTASRSVTVETTSSARIVDYACTHSVSSAYDGITLFVTSGSNSMSGLVSVYGLGG